MPDVSETTVQAAPAAAAPRPDGPDAAERAGRAAAALQTALEAMRRHDPYYDLPLPAPVQGHGPVHPAGKAARELGRLVAAYRAAHGLTQAVLGVRLGWPQPNVARLEAGQRTPDLATLDRLARRLGLEVTVRATRDELTVEVREPVA
jgi:hypothetical protein